MLANDKYLNRNNRLIKKLYKKENYFGESFENFDLIFLLTLCYFILICKNKKKVSVDMVVVNILNTKSSFYSCLINGESSDFCMTETFHEISYELLSFFKNMVSFLRTFIEIIRN
jgi:hypothetical protein